MPIKSHLQFLLIVSLALSTTTAPAQKTDKRRELEIVESRTSAPCKDMDHGVTSTGMSTSRAVIFKHVDQMPSFPGDLNTFIMKHLHYPNSTREAGVEGRIVIEFIVRKDGSLTDTKVIRSVGEGLDKEVLRLISIMPHWKPGRNKGLPVDVAITLPIIIELE